MKRNPFKQPVFIVLLVLKGISAGAQNADEFYATGNDLSGKRQYDAAIEQYNKAIALKPEFASAYINRGNVYANKKMYDEAIKDYNTSLLYDANSKIAYFNRGLANKGKNLVAKAIADYTKAISIAPDYALAWCSRGTIYYGKEMYDEAIKDLNQALAIDPRYEYAYQVRGNAYYAKRLYDYALPDYNAAINIQPKNPVNYRHRGSLFNATRQYDAALKDFNQGIAVGPKYQLGYTGRASTYTSTKKYDLAIADLTMALSLDSTGVAVYNSRGLAYLFKGQYELAVSDFKKGILSDTNKEKPYVILNIIEPLARLYRFADAAQYYNDYRNGYAGGYINNKGWLFFERYIEAVTQNLSKNDYATALVNLNDAEKLYSTKNKGDSGDNSQQRGYSSILALKGYVLERLNDNEKAKQAYEQALIINENEPEVTAALQRLSKKNEVLVKDDNTPPTLNILEPSANNRSIAVEDDKVAGAKQRIRGQAIDVSGIRSIMINNKQLRVEENGYFDTEVDIKDGINVFTIVVTDNNANSISENVQVVTGKDKAGAPQVASPVAATVVNYNPVYHAVLIGESEYADKNIPSLQGPVTDMLKIYNLLVKNYVFAPENTDTLVNASRASILETIIKKANAMGENDNLFIFYAGHGQMITQPDQSEEGFLVPQDAVKGMLSSYISSDDLLRTIKYSKAKHILLVADACFAGSLFRDLPADAPATVAEAYKDKSRKLLASGNRTAVPDKSEFIEYLRLALQENHQPYITAEQLIDSFKNEYKSSTHLSLQYFPIKNVDDLGGQFVFMRK